MTLVPARKWLVIALALGTLVLATLWQQLSLTLLARLLLGLCALGALVWWARRARRTGAGFTRPKRLEVVHRVGLSARTSVALVEVDGQPYLIVHGEGFARLRPTRKPRLPRVEGVLELPMARGWS